MMYRKEVAFTNLFLTVSFCFNFKWGHILFGSKVNDKLPQGLAGVLGVHIPDGVGNSGSSKMNDTLFRAEPTVLRVRHHFKKDVS